MTAAGRLPTRRSIAARLARWAAGLLVVVLAVIVLAGLAIYAAGEAGVGTGRLRLEAEKAIRSATGMNVDVALGRVRLTFDGVRLLAIEADDVHVAEAGTGEAILDGGRLRFGLRFLPLLEGRVRLGNASLFKARLVPSRVHRTGGPQWNPDIRNAQGLIDPGLVSQLVFRELHRTFDFIASAGTRRLHLEGVILALPDRGATLDLSVNELTITRARTGRISFAGDAGFLSRRVLFDGSAARSPDKSMIEALDATLSVSQRDQPSTVADAAAANQDNPQTTFGTFTLAVNGKQTGADADHLSLDFHLADARMDLGEQGRMSASGEISASISSNSDAISIDRARLAAGRSKFDFSGRLSPLTGPAADSQPAYGLQLVSRHSLVAPTDSPEPALQIKAHVLGRYVPEAHEIVADKVEVQTPAGRMIASASMRFVAGETPGVSLGISASGLPTSHVKQLWPWFAAWGPRKWVLEHVFDGTVQEADIRLSVPPGRLGNGEPLTAEEVHGQFKVRGTRFDIAGKMPPVRDGDGDIDFAGTDTKITLTAGSVFMPGGMSVSTDGGTFSIENAEIFPRIGQLEIDVAGTAPAIMKLASYDPINAGRFLDMKPHDLSGKVEGHISAGIPLDEGDSSAKLDWKASFSFHDLALAKPISGQTISDAEGTLALGPDRADIQADARLNEIPATIDMVEPLGGSDVKRKRDIVLTLDDKARDKLAPGLGTILSGPATINFDAGGEDRQDVSMDLTQATLTLPWIGWQKGKGIPAKASFVLVRKGDDIGLEDFSLSGDSFAARGEVDLTKGSLSSARFTSAKLNRGDDFAVTVRRSGEGYAVAVNGDAVDARALVKHLSGNEAGGGKDGSTPIRLDAKLDKVSGFNDQSLRGVTLAYSGRGSTVSTMKLSAATKSGGNLSADEAKGSLRVDATDAGAVLSFLDYYPHMRGGRLTLSLAKRGDGSLAGKADIRDFSIVNEPRLGSLVSAAPSSSRGSMVPTDGRKINVSSVNFDRGSAGIAMGNGYMKIARGILRGPSIGATFQGTLYDPNGNIALTGTFMPLYGLNRVFGEIPLFGKILGNGRDRGLIGVTFKLTGKTNKPDLQINPISVIAPGILRQIFEFH